MRQLISILLLIIYSVSIVTPSMALIEKNKIKIIKIKGTRFVVDHGSRQGIQKNAYYLILRENKIIGTAEVLAVRTNISAMQISNMRIAGTIQPTDVLQLDNHSAIEAERLLQQLNQSPSFDSSHLTQDDKNYYFLGQEAANDEYQPAEAFLGGLISGSLLGLIGWGVGYAIMSTEDPYVPIKHTETLNHAARFQFTTGYKEKAKQKRNNAFHGGALFGTLIAVAWIVSLQPTY